MTKVKKTATKKPKSEIQKELGRRTPSRGKASGRPAARKAMKPTRGR
jgi:hypothetical protein